MSNLTAPALVIRTDGDNGYLFIESQMGTPVGETVPLRSKLGDGMTVIMMMRAASSWAETMGYDEPDWHPEDDTTAVAALVPVADSPYTEALTPSLSDDDGDEDEEGEEVE